MDEHVEQGRLRVELRAQLGPLGPLRLAELLEHPDRAVPARDVRQDAVGTHGDATPDLEPRHVVEPPHATVGVADAVVDLQRSDVLEGTDTRLEQPFSIGRMHLRQPQSGSGHPLVGDEAEQAVDPGA